MKFAGKKVIGSGLLELTTYSLERSPDYIKDFGMVRVTEIIGGDPQWNQDEVTYNTMQGSIDKQCFELANDYRCQYNRKTRIKNSNYNFKSCSSTYD